jgi:hypothetical protein
MQHQSGHFCCAERECAAVALFLLNSQSGHAGMAAKYEKDRKGNKEDVALKTLARSQVSFYQIKKIDEVFEGLGKTRWGPQAFSALLALSALLVISAP